MSINLHLPENVVLKPCITVFGAGGAGGNAVNNMISSNLEGAKFVVANTDAQALEFSKADHKIQLGESLTRGLGAGASPDIGRAAAEEAIEEILEQLDGSNMVFITAGMGGGTGTGAAPVIAKAARERGILTVGVVTKPFNFEGAHRMRIAESGLSEMQKHVDTLIVIPNQNLFRIANEKTTFADAFKLADDVLHAGVRGVTDLMTMPGLINLDFADIRSVMSEMGKAMMGTGEAEGENRAIVAAESAISNPLLDHSSMKGAQGVLINITGGSDMTLFEVDEAANRVREEVDPDANIIFGSAFNENLEGKIRVSVVATGIEDPNSHPKKEVITSAPKTSYNNFWDRETKPEPEKQNFSPRQEPERRNIPSYAAPLEPDFKAPELTPRNDKENVTQEALNEEQQQTNEEVKPTAADLTQKEEVFIAPKPIEPAIKNTPSISARDSFLNKPLFKEEMQEEDKPKSFSGLFGRILSGGKKEEPKKEKIYADDIEDIPAFQRRNNPKYD